MIEATAHVMDLCWPPEWAERSNAEGWYIVEEGNPDGSVEIVRRENPAHGTNSGTYHCEAIAWVILNAWLGSPMHQMALRFEAYAGREDYTQGELPPTLR